MHFRINAEGYDELITALYLRVTHSRQARCVGVKSSLIVDLDDATKEEADKYGFEEEGGRF